MAAAFLALDSEFLLTDTEDILVERSFLVLELGKLNLFHLIVPDSCASDMCYGLVTLLKKRLQRSCLPLKFANFLKNTLCIFVMSGLQNVFLRVMI